MKQYDRESKKWITEEEAHIKLKRRSSCKGGRDHDWILVLPPYAHASDGGHGIDIAERYYEIEAEIEKLMQEKDEKLREIGVERSRIVSKSSRYFVCCVCGKNKADF